MEMKKSWILEAVILAIGLVVLGFNIKAGIEEFVSKDRKVTVKGLSEMEVPANKVTWPIVSKELGNDLPELYNRIAGKQHAIKRFLIANGISDKEITVNAPQVVDLSAGK